MASNQYSQPSVAYDPLPLGTDDHRSPGLYNQPLPSTDNLHNSPYHTPQQNPIELEDVGAIPAGAGQPRFLGASMYNDNGYRSSLASSQYSLPNAPSEYNNSVYALNPEGGFSGGYRDDPRASYALGEHGSIPMSPVSPKEQNRFLQEKHATYAAPRAKSRKKLMVIAGIIGAILLIAAVAVPVYLFVIKPKQGENGGSGSSGNSTAGPHATGTSKPTRTFTGGDGSTVTMEDGTTFVYKNSLGGYWYDDENDPFNNGARAQSWSPALNETFNYGVDKIRGVNLGGWLLTEPFISPALYEKYATATPQAVDEWTLSQAMRADTAGGGINQLEDHYKTFITEKDFAEIASAGLNFVRIPLGFWAVESHDGEPFLSKVSWT
jgi:glucan 1,3-beta-glucosidase